jgi:CRP-like cAMP-binding protein
MEHTEAVAARIREQIAELEAELVVHRRALAALGEGSEEESAGAGEESRSLLGKSLGEVRTRRRSAGKRGERESAGSGGSERPNRQDDDAEEAGEASSRSRGAENGAEGSGGSRDEGNHGVSADGVLRALRDGHRRPADIANHLGVPVSTVSRRLRELVETGRIRRRRR